MGRAVVGCPSECIPPWRPSNFGRPEQSHFNKLPDLRELLNQAEEAKARKRMPIQSVAPMPLPFASARDLDCQRQQHHDQTMAKCQFSLLDGEQRKRAKTPLQPDPYNALDVECGWAEQNQGRHRGRSRTRVERQSELDRTHSKSRKRSKSCQRSKSRKHSKSRRRSKSRKHDGGRERDKHEPHRPGVWPSQCEQEVPNWSPRSIAQKDVRGAGHSVPSNDLSKFLKLKDEVVKNAQSYIRRHATVIFRTLSPDHEAVKCLSEFGDQAQKFAAEVLAIIEWGTQHWKLQESFPVPVIPRWLRTPEFTQTTTPLRGELPLMPMGGHFEDIRMRCPAMWSWIAVLLQYWQDHMTPHLYGGQFGRISNLVATLIQDINLWLPHQARFGWGYVAMNTTLWIDQWDYFFMEHLEEWAEQKEQECALNDLERDMEVVYRARIIRRQEDKLLTDSKEAAAKDLPPERRAACAERQAGTTLRKDGVSSTSMSATLYPDWVLSRAGRPMSPDTPQPYWTPREDAGECLTLEEELDASSVFDPLQSSQGAEGPWTLPHYSETPTYIPPFDIAKVGVLPKMLPITDQENALLNLAPGSPVTRATPPGLSRGQGGSGRSSCSGSPMSLGSPAVGSSLPLALKVCTRLGTPSTFGGREELPRGAVEEEEEEMDATENDDADQAKD